MGLWRFFLCVILKLAWNFVDDFPRFPHDFPTISQANIVNGKRFTVFPFPRGVTLLKKVAL
jgi:hypothetical protein